MKTGPPKTQVTNDRETQASNRVRHRTGRRADRGKYRERFRPIGATAMTDYQPCTGFHCHRLASHRVHHHDAGPLDSTAWDDFCLDHASEQLREQGDVTVTPLNRIPAVTP